MKQLSFKIALSNIQWYVQKNSISSIGFKYSQNTLWQADFFKQRAMKLLGICKELFLLGPF